MKLLTHLGMTMPALGFGTWQLTGPACIKAVRSALEIGYRHIDTAQIYGNEAEVGTALAQSGVPRSDIFLTTKIWMDRLAYRDVLDSVEESLARLATSYVDLLLIHWPKADMVLADTLEAMAELQVQGKARAIGVSNFPVAWLRRAVEDHGAELFCNQVEYHALLAQKALLDYMRPRGMILTAYSPLAQGRLAGDRTLAAIGNKHGKTASQVALRWLIEQDNVAAIPKAGSEKHARANFEIFDFTLDREDMAQLGRLPGNIRTIDPSWSPDWDH